MPERHPRDSAQELPIEGDSRSALHTRELTASDGSVLGSRLKRSAVTFSWILYSCALCLLYTNIPPYPDLAIFDYIGWVLSDGGRLYVDVTEHNWPGAPWVHWLATEAFGNHLWTFRLLDFLFATSAAIAMASLVRPVAGFAAACLTVPLYQTMYATLGCYVAGERDLLASHFLIFGILTYRARSRGGPIGWLVLTAGALSLAVLTRPTYLAFAPLAAVAIMLTRAGEAKPGPRQSQDVYKIAAFFMGTMAIVALIGLWRGTLGAWYEVGIRFNMDVNSVKSTSYRDLVLMLGKYVIGWWHWYFALATIGGLAWWRCRKDRLTLYLLLSLALAAFISFFVQRKGATYHLAGMIPVLCPLIASLIGWCLTQFRVRATLAKRAAGTCVVIIVLVGCGLKIANAFRPQFAWLTGGISREMMLERMPTSVNGVTYADVVEASDLVKRTVPAGKTVLVWGRCVEINYLSKRRSPTRFITFGMLRVARDPFFLATKWAEEFERAFDEAPPEVIVLPGLGTNEDYAELWLDPSPSRSLLVLQSQIRNRYHKWKSIGALDLYQLTPGR